MFFLDFSDRVPSATLPGRSNRFGTFGHRMVSILTVLKRISRPGRLFRAWFQPTHASSQRPTDDSNDTL